MVVHTYTPSTLENCHKSEAKMAVWGVPLNRSYIAKFISKKPQIQEPNISKNFQLLLAGKMNVFISR